MSFIPPRHSDAEHNLKMHQENVCSVGAKHMVDASTCVMLLMLMLDEQMWYADARVVHSIDQIK